MLVEKMDSRKFKSFDGHDYITRTYKVTPTIEDVEKFVSLKEVFMTLKWLAENNNGHCMAEFLQKAISTKFHNRLKAQMNFVETEWEGDVEVRNNVRVESQYVPGKYGKGHLVTPIETYVNKCLKTFFDYKMIERSETTKTVYYSRSRYSGSSAKKYKVASYILTEKGKRVK